MSTVMRMRLVTAAGDEVHVEALRGAAARQGYRGRKEPGPHEGLFFPMGRRGPIAPFTMVGVPFDLDLVLLDRSGGLPAFTVVGVQRLHAGEERHDVGLDGVAALEVAAGEAERLGIVVGSLMSIAW
jgi:uncharacterized membrane protein (UPF0127 family)